MTLEQEWRTRCVRVFDSWVIIINYYIVPPGWHTVSVDLSQRHHEDMKQRAKVLGRLGEH